MRIYQHYIDGAFAEPSSAAWFDSTDPYSGEVWVNTYRAVSFTSPFGGYKRSGIGRESGLEGI